MYSAKFSLRLLFGICCLISVSLSVGEASALSSSVKSSGREVLLHGDTSRSENPSPLVSLRKRQIGCRPIYGSLRSRDFFEHGSESGVYSYHPETIRTVTCSDSCGPGCRDIEATMWVTRIRMYGCLPRQQTRSKRVPVECSCV